MDTILQRIQGLQISDIMSRQVLSVTPSQSMSEVAVFFQSKGIGIAPVVDDKGCCIGVISATDFVRRESMYARCEGEPHRLVSDEDGATHIEPASTELVGDCMSHGVQTVSPDTKLMQAARIMSDGHLHGLPVLENERPIGFVSNIDVVAALVNAVDEAKMLND